MCWLFGHKFVHKTKDETPLNFFTTRVVTRWQTLDNCIRCGIDKE